MVASVGANPTVGPCAVSFTVRSLLATESVTFRYRRLFGRDSSAELAGPVDQIEIDRHERPLRPVRKASRVTSIITSEAFSAPVFRSNIRPGPTLWYWPARRPNGNGRKSGCQVVAAAARAG